MTVECRACRGDWPAAAAHIADCGPAAAYLHSDQFFPGWTLLVLKRHATELWQLDPNERHALIDGVDHRQTGGRIRRRPRLGGLLNYYERAA